MEEQMSSQPIASATRTYQQMTNNLDNQQEPLVGDQPTRQPHTLENKASTFNTNLYMGEEVDTPLHSTGTYPASEHKHPRTTPEIQGVKPGITPASWKRECSPPQKALEWLEVGESTAKAPHLARPRTASRPKKKCPRKANQRIPQVEGQERINSHVAEAPPSPITMTPNRGNDRTNEPSPASTKFR